jgi:CO/xanthine dehydrogenase Mo-binding subunit
MVAEVVMERVAAELRLSPLDVREPALYREGDVTHFGMVRGAPGGVWCVV